MRDPLHVALVGYGYAGRVFHAPLIAHTDGLRLHTVVSRDAARVHADHPDVRVVRDPATAFADDAIDLVVIATPNDTHAPLALAALAAGRHVVVDKPFATSPAEAQAVVDAAARAGRIASVFHNRRWDDDFLALRALVEDGTLGEVVELHSHFDRFRPQVPDRWRERAGAGTGLWFDLGPHLVDQALQLVGPPLALQADIARQREGAVVDDWFHVVLRYPRLRVVLHAGALVAAPGPRFAAHGTRGSFRVDGLDGQEARLKAGIAPGTGAAGATPRHGRITRIEDGTARETNIALHAADYRAYYAGLRDAIRTGTAPPVTARQALDVMRVLALAIDSAGDGRARSLE
jgi:predicted dehydrogenase